MEEKNKKEEEKKEEKEIDKEEVQKLRENKQLKVFFVGVGAIVIVILMGMFILNQIRHFEHDGVTFNVIKEQDLIFYQTMFLVTYQGKPTEYSFYIRNDPRKLEKEIPFDGKLEFRDYAIINMSGSDFNCDGDGVIGIANLLKGFEVIGTNVGKDANATCDEEGRYIFLQIQPGNETKIEQVGSTCYIMHVNNCEILKATERYMVETFEKVHAEWL